MIIFYAKSIENGRAALVDEECRHCAKVLRKKEGEEVMITDGKGSLYSGVILSTGKKEVLISSLELVEKKKPGHKRGIAIAPTKNIDRYEWFLEKCTEIGITDIYPFLSKRSERKVIKPERLEKILVSAMKQSKNFHKPILHDLIPIKEMVALDLETENKFIAHCMEPESALQKLYNSGEDAVVLIGPEGDFTEDEVALANEHKWTEVSLGASRLRTETAGIVACHLLNL